MLEKFEGAEDKTDALSRDVRELSLRVTGLEMYRQHTQGADAIRSRIWTWVLGIVAVVIAGLIMLAVRGLGR